MLTTVTDSKLAKLFSEAGIPATVEAEMESWLRTRAAMVVPFMTTVSTADQRQAGVSWAEARQATRAMQEGFQLVRKLGTPPDPGPNGRPEPLARPCDRNPALAEFPGAHHAQERYGWPAP